jgi:hypothetical protein
MALWLDPIPEGLRTLAAENLDAGDVVGFLCRTSNVHSLDLVYWNLDALRARGLYERALLEAWAATRTNNHHWPVHELRYLFIQADRERLRAASDPLPGPGPFTVYRGVGGRGPARRVRGLAWTASEDKAWWFADRADWFRLADPAVYRVTVDEAHVLAYLNESQRNEQEFLVLLPATARPARMPKSA